VAPDLQEFHRERGGGLMSTAATADIDDTAATPLRPTRRRARDSVWAVLAWVIALGFFFPVLWMVLTAFKEEGDAYTDPPKLFFTPTLQQFRDVLDSGIGTTLLNSVFATGISTLLVLLLG